MIQRGAALAEARGSAFDGSAVSSLEAAAAAAPPPPPPPPHSAPSKAIFTSKR